MLFPSSRKLLNLEIFLSFIFITFVLSTYCFDVPNIMITSQACVAPPPLPTGPTSLVHYFALFTLTLDGSTYLSWKVVSSLCQKKICCGKHNNLYLGFITPSGGWKSPFTSLLFYNHCFNYILQAVLNT
jgi:hypothetical protein